MKTPQVAAMPGMTPMGFKQMDFMIVYYDHDTKNWEDAQVLLRIKNEFTEREAFLRMDALRIERNKPEAKYKVMHRSNYRV